LQRNIIRFGLPVVLAAVLGACSSSSGSNGGAAGSGGSSGTGGVPSSSGGGSPIGSGGAPTQSGGSGGTSASGTGGAIGGTGGASSNTGGSGGSLATGGTSSNGGGDSGVLGDAGPNGPTEPEFLAAFAAASCTALDQCLGPAQGTYFNGATCKDVLVPGTNEGPLSLVPAAVQQGAVNYDGTNVDACLAMVRKAGCGLLVHRFGTICPGVLVGTVAVGGDCAINSECVAGAYCKMGASCPGKCTKLGTTGTTCASSGDCADGLICGTDKQCVAPGQAGAACGQPADPPCAPALSCDATSSKCVTFSSLFAAPLGATCDPSSRTLCVGGLVCGLTALNAITGAPTWNCEKPVTGADCHLAIPEECPSGQYCELGTQGVSGTCKAAPGNSAACASHIPSDSTTAVDVCAPPLACGSDGTCHATAHDGSACAADGDCYSGACSSGKCVAARCTP